MAQPVVVFDGECGLCNGFVAWLLRHDTAGSFRIAGSAGEVGRALVADAGLPPELPDSTIVVLVDGEAHTRTDALIHVARGLPAPWSWARAMHVVPTGWRDAMYAQIAKRRPRVDADDPACGVPPADLTRLWRERLATDADVEAHRTAATA